MTERATGVVSERLGAGERVYLKVMRWLPVLWPLGLHIVFPLLWTAATAARKGLSRGPAQIVAWSWIVVGFSQAISIIANWAMQGGTPFDLVGLLVTVPVFGWIVLGMAIGVGARVCGASKQFVRHVSLLSVQTFAIGIVAIGVSLALQQPSLMISTPLRQIAGGGLASDFYLNMNVYFLEYSFGVMFPRLMIFQPWPTALGLAGIFFAMISLTEDRRNWRRAAFIGGVFAVAMSASRAAYVLLPLAMGLYIITRLRQGVALALVSGALLVLAIVAIPDVFDWGGSLLHSFTNARAGSSMARDLIYAESWRAFLAAPWVGYGWIGQSVHSHEPLPIGSHSTIFGVLYTGGLLTFVPLMFATAATVYSALAALRHGGRHASAALAMVVVSIAFAYGESMYSLVPSCIPGFLFIGGAIAGGRRSVGASASMHQAKQTSLGGAALRKA